MLFSFSKPKKPKLNYRVYLSKVLKYQQLIGILREKKESVVILYFFDQTRAELEALLNAAQMNSFELLSAFDRVPKERLLILAEIHPHQTVMKKLQSNFESSDVIDCYIGMDEVLLKAFGSERTIELMEKLGMDPHESLSHPMIDRSIDNALAKVDGKLKQPIDVRSSPEEWARANGLN